MIAPDGTAFEITGDGPAAVLVHGFGLDRQMWQWLVPDLTGFQVVTYDLIGHGQSPDPRGEPDLRMFAEQVLRLIDHCRIARCAVVGFSLGGMIARRFALDHADRMTALAILNSAHDRTPEQRAAILKRVESARRSGPSATVESALGRWFTASFQHTNPALMDQVRRWVLANRPNVYPAIYQVMAEADAELVEPIRAIRCPTLVMTGEEDHGNSPAMTLRMAEAIPGAEAVVLPGLRHMVLAENPASFNGPLVDFLSRAHFSAGAGGR